MLALSSCVSNTPTIPRIAVSPGAAERLARFGPVKRAEERTVGVVAAAEGADQDGPFFQLSSGTAAFRVRCGALEPGLLQRSAGDDGEDVPQQFVAAGTVSLASDRNCRVLRTRTVGTAPSAVAVVMVAGDVTTTVRLTAGDRAVLVETTGAVSEDALDGPSTLGFSPLLRDRCAETESGSFEATYAARISSQPNVPAFAITGTDGVIELPCKMHPHLPSGRGSRTSSGPIEQLKTVGSARVVVVASSADEASVVAELERAAGHTPTVVRVTNGAVGDALSLFERATKREVLAIVLHDDGGGAPYTELPAGDFLIGRTLEKAVPLKIANSSEIRVRLSD